MHFQLSSNSAFVFVSLMICFSGVPLFWFRKIPRDLTEASLSGAGLSIVAALFMMFLFGMVKSSLGSVVYFSKYDLFHLSLFDQV